ncbi:MAG: dCMP deaminase family protein [Clostridiales bacterium]|nr:dCMP deaminase family protein [Clostridiales bacterium]MBQ2605634.1 dCMP deaminase family protein [Clostridiales bacterium]MBQ4191020.1 dCMP deaminase family protein [Clostridiales bacterium]MBQ4217330.1 dCMP deaminase family protein [Clostridiales bacterium]MBQ5422776.1 dCMP deaminase family protein [Clostridiales bacterium]
MKRADYISWNEYFMGVATLASKRSKDPNTQVGACIVDKDNYIVSVGYNGMPLGCSDDEFPWERQGGTLDTKYAYVTHAELNAILNSKTANLEGSTVYVTLFPCNECTKALIQKRIGKIVYLDDKYHDTDTSEAARRMLDSAGVKYERYDLTGRDITISL